MESMMFLLTLKNNKKQMKIKNILLILLLSTVIFSCDTNGNGNDENFDAAAQAIIDDEALVEYLQTHYLKEEDDAIWTIENGEEALINNVEEQEIVKDDITYTLYYLNKNIGVGVSPKESDSVLVTYAGMTLDSVVFDSRNSLTWFSLTSVVSGWSYGLTNFKGGTKVIEVDESFVFENSGDGYIFFPSGLGYGNVPQSIIPENSPLIFKIELNDVNPSDHDNDGVLSYLEDINEDGNVKNDDSDEDSIPDYLDIDDDGDGILTKDELGDENGDNIPDYLDPEN